MLDSRSLGLPHRGRLVRGVRLPPRGAALRHLGPAPAALPSRWWRRYGNDYLVRMVLRVARRHAAADPEPPPPMLVGDLSRPRGGEFGRRFGALGHSSHQNGLDVDVYYPRRDQRDRAADGRSARWTSGSPSGWWTCSWPPARRRCWWVRTCR